MRSDIVLIVLGFVVATGCDGTSPGALDDAGAADAATSGGDPTFVASCVYENTFAMSPECREYRGPGWSEASVTRDCRRVFLGMAGELRVGEACAFEDTIGRCTVGEVGGAGGYVIVSAGDASTCGAAQTGCETFAGGTFEPSPACNGCAATGDEGPGAIVPAAPDCRDPLPGEAPGATDGRVCTPVMISGSTEPGRRYADYADCDVVRTQRPYYASSAEVTQDPSDPRLSDADYLAEVAWVREQAEASACSCCHTSSRTPSGAAIWDTEAGPLWVDTVSDEALAMLAGFTDSAAFGFFEAEDNNGFDRSVTGLPTTDATRLRDFAELELERRGLTTAEAAALPPFAPFFRDLIEYEPEPCAEGIGVDADGVLRWSGGAARYVWILEADARAPGVPPNWDLPEGTRWAVSVGPDADAIGCGFRYGQVDDGVVQRAPRDGAPPPLESGQTYFLAVMRDIAQPITRCLFVAP